MDRRALQRLIEGERRQDGAEAPGHHGLAGTWGAGEQEVVATGGGHFERTTGQQLATDVGQVAIAMRCGGGYDLRCGHRALRFVRPVQGINRFGQRPGGVDLEAFDHTGFGPILRRQQQPLQPQSTRGDGDRQHAPDAVDGAVERQLADDHGVVDGASGQWAGGREQAQRNRQVEG